MRHEDLILKCFADLVEELRQLLPGFGDKLAVDSTDIKAYASGYRKSPSDPDARWGAKGAGHHAVPYRGNADKEGRRSNATYTTGLVTSYPW